MRRSSVFRFVLGCFPLFLMLAGCPEKKEEPEAGPATAAAAPEDLLPGAWVIPTPRYPTYTLWWSWLKNYSGENSVGWLAFNWSKWVWVDQDIKDTMGH